MKNSPAYIASLSEIATNYDAFILDLWGVVHDGKNLYPGTLETLKKLRGVGKKITFLSNAPRRAHVVAESLKGMGIGAELYDAIVTSGETAYLCLQNPEDSPFKPQGPSYLYIGLERDRIILEGLSYKEATQPEQAHFVMLSHSFEDNQPMETLRPLFEQCVKLNLPVVCINPDKEVVRLTGERVYCAGALAQEYQNMGGQVVYFGKPHRAVYECALATLQGVKRSRIVAVGDSLGTDILGGSRTKLATVLVAGGILKETLGDAEAGDFKQKSLKLFEREQIAPDYVVPAFTYII